MSKSFRDLVEAINAKQEKEKSELKPRSKGEQEFAADQGYPPKIGGDRDKEYPEPNTDKTLNARSAKKTNMHDAPVPGNETGKQPMQGSSKVGEVKTFRDLVAGLKQTAGGRGFQIGSGDVKVVRTSPTSVKGVEDSESMNESWEAVKHRQSGKTIGKAKQTEQGWIVRSKNGAREYTGGHKPDLIDRLHDYADRHSVNEDTDEDLDEALDPLSIGLGAAGAMYIGHKWKQAGKELEATDKAHHDTVQSLLNRDVDSHEVTGHRKHRIRYKNGNTLDVRTSGYGTSHITHKDRDGKTLYKRTIKHDVKKLAKNLEESGLSPDTLNGYIHGATRDRDFFKKRADMFADAASKGHSSVASTATREYRLADKRNEGIRKAKKNLGQDNLDEEGGFTPPATQAPKPPKMKAPKVVKAPTAQMDEQLAYIAESGKAAMVSFADGDTATVNPSTASKMLDTLDALNETNSRRFLETINSGAEGFAKMMNFAERN